MSTLYSAASDASGSCNAGPDCASEPAVLNAELRAIHQRSRRRSPNPGDGLGVHELFTANSSDRAIILDAIDLGRHRLAMYLLGHIDERELVSVVAPI